MSSLTYRSEIDGLRGIAVLAVVFYHAGLSFPGGFIGVDVFFVISGFLITSIIYGDLRAGNFSFLGFWEKRARRIIPASAVMVFSVLLMGWFLTSPYDFVSIGFSALSTTLFASNIYFWKRTGNYFAADSGWEPLLHTWSLSVEEQFYFVIPALLFLFWWYRLTRRHSAVLSLLSVMTVVSFWVSVRWVNSDPSAAFFLLPSRAWEMLLGSIIAFIPTWKGGKDSLRGIVCGLGLLGIIAPFFLYSKETEFPGKSALLPCLGTATLIWASGSSRECTGWLFKRLMGLLQGTYLVSIGRISYSLYLWHWPLFAFLSHITLGESHWLVRAAIMLLSFLPAYLSWRLVEQPFRKRSAGHNRRSLFVWVGALILPIVIFAILIISNSGFPKRVSEEILALDALKDPELRANEYTEPISINRALEGELPLYGNKDSASVGLLVWGDSHARSVLPALGALGEQNSVAIASAWFSATPPVFDYVPPHGSYRNEVIALQSAVRDYIVEHQITSVLLVARWSAYFRWDAESEPAERGELALHLVETIRKLKAIGATPYLLVEVPNQIVDVPKALISNKMFGSDLSKIKISRQDLYKQNKSFFDLSEELTAAGAVLIDSSGAFIDSSTNLCQMAFADEALYFDKHHLSKQGALHILKFFEIVFE